jgi:hypothetical protein
MSAVFVLYGLDSHASSTSNNYSLFHRGPGTITVHSLTFPHNTAAVLKTIGGVEPRVFDCEPAVPNDLERLLVLISSREKSAQAHTTYVVFSVKLLEELLSGKKTCIGELPPDPFCLVPVMINKNSLEKAEAVVGGMVSLQNDCMYLLAPYFLNHQQLIQAAVGKKSAYEPNMPTMPRWPSNPSQAAVLADSYLSTVATIYQRLMLAGWSNPAYEDSKSFAHVFVQAVLKTKIQREEYEYSLAHQD